MAHMQHSAKGTTWEKRGHRWVRRVKGPDGKWRYYYKDGGDKYGKYTGAFDKNHTYTYQKGDGVLDTEEQRLVGVNFKSPNNKIKSFDSSTIIYTEGKLSRGIEALANKGKSFLDKFLKK